MRGRVFDVLDALVVALFWVVIVVMALSVFFVVRGAL